MNSSSNTKKICVLGLGYIGLPTAALLANRGFKVLGVDVSSTVVDTINEGRTHIVEPGLAAFVEAAIKSKRLSASLKPEPADVFIIAVPTPFYADSHAPNLEYVFEAARMIAPFVADGNLVILESTSPVGTTEKVAEVFAEGLGESKKLFIGHCPERVLPGKIMSELIENSRIVGGIDSASSEKIADFYKVFVQGEVIKTDARTAELTKLTENASRDIGIALVNELSMICDKYGINVYELISLANRHPRVQLLNPGPGVGGHCIAIDPWFIVHENQDLARLIKTAREVNNQKPKWVLQKIKDTVSQLKKPSNEALVTCLGLAYKPNVDDFRESPALNIFTWLIEEGINAKAVEPYADESIKGLPLISLEKAMESSDVLVVLVSHDEFKGLSVPAPGPQVLDFVGLLNKP